MNKQDFEELAAYILLHNKGFAKGFANAFKDELNNAIWTRDGGDMKCLMPVDVYGGYFYLRSESAIKYEAKYDERVTDSGVQRLIFQDSMIIYLVAMIDNTDENKLIEDLRNTCMSYNYMNVIPLSASWNREQIIAEELSEMKEADVRAALQRLRNHVLVKLTLNVTKYFVPANCLFTN